MEATRFDAWTRRRFGLVAGGLATLLPALSWALIGEAKGRRKHGKSPHRSHAAKLKAKRKKKRCPKCPECPAGLCQKPGESCEGGCCDGLVCGDNGCNDQQVCCGEAGAACEAPCDCCGELSCGGDGTCTCFGTMCGDECVRGFECCADDECSAGLVCTNGSCRCPNGGFFCGDACCDPAAGEVCDLATQTCQSGGCPVTDYCSDGETHRCEGDCFCVTSVEGVSGCAFWDFGCLTCESDAECTDSLGEPGLCVPNGSQCGCNGSFCMYTSCSESLSSTGQAQGKSDNHAPGRGKRARSHPHGQAQRKHDDRRGTPDDGPLSGAVMASLRDGHDAAAQGRGRKAKKKRCPTCPTCPRLCEAVQQRCHDDCCDGLTCGDNGCENRQIPVCCGELGAPCEQPCDCCGRNTICRDGTCQCRFPCGDPCAAACCEDTDCPGELSCQGGFFCGCTHGLNCDTECCDIEAGQVCHADIGACIDGGCPVTELCSPSFQIYRCDEGCVCTTSVDGQSACIDFINYTDCLACTSDAECTTALGQAAVCLPTGEFCSCETSFCVPASCSFSSGQDADARAKVAAPASLHEDKARKGSPGRGGKDGGKSRRWRHRHPRSSGRDANKPKRRRS